MAEREIVWFCGQGCRRFFRYRTDAEKHEDQCNGYPIMLALNEPIVGETGYRS